MRTVSFEQNLRVMVPHIKLRTGLRLCIWGRCRIAPTISLAQNWNQFPENRTARRRKMPIRRRLGSSRRRTIRSPRSKPQRIITEMVRLRVIRCFRFRVIKAHRSSPPRTSRGAGSIITSRAPPAWAPSPTRALWFLVSIWLIRQTVSCSSALTGNSHNFMRSRFPTPETWARTRW